MAGGLRGRWDTSSVSATPDTHLLRQLQLPARYEPLVARVGVEVAQLLVEPGAATTATVQRAALAVRARGEGLLVPLVGRSGTGKTTLASNLTAFLPEEYAATVTHDGDVSFAALRTATAGNLQHNDDRIVPINIDHREATPPNAAELAEIKRFLRDRELGARAIIFWPQTSTLQANEMAKAYSEVVGRPPIELPVTVEGPSRDMWIDIALHTLRLANDMIESLEETGVDPRDYDPAAYETVGDYLRQVADDFADYQQRLLKELRVPLRLIVVFASESGNPGVLSQLTSGTRYGFLDASALLDATPLSRPGKFWSSRRGALTQTIVRLDARALCLPPTAALPILRRFGGDDVKESLRALGIEDRGSAEVARSFRRSELGQSLLGAPRAAFEARGTPSTQALPAFQLLAEGSFVLGRDKGYNKSMAEGITDFLTIEGLDATAVAPERGLADSKLIPDNAIDRGDHVVCIEYTWRRGDFLTSANRSTIAQYILDKLKNYAVDLRWIDP
jgi:energy-coupling factor transporter ATP-binding protein EcfA2